MGQVNLYFAIGTLVQQDHVQHQNQALINRCVTVELEEIIYQSFNNMKWNYWFYHYLYCYLYLQKVLGQDAQRIYQIEMGK